MENEKHTPLKCNVSIDEKWINRFLEKKKYEFPIHEKYTLNKFHVVISSEAIGITASIREKRATKLEITILPFWSESEQKLQIRELKVGTSTKNIFLKSAGWIAQAFLNATIDRKLEEVTNEMIQKQMKKLRAKPLSIPVPLGGVVAASVQALTIHDVFLSEGKIEAAVHVEAAWDVRLH